MSKSRHPSPPIAGIEPYTLRADQIDLGPPALFSLGYVVATPAALALVQEHGASVPELLHRHLTGDWQEMCREDQDANWATVARRRIPCVLLIQHCPEQPYRRTRQDLGHHRMGSVGDDSFTPRGSLNALGTSLNTVSA